LEEASAAIFVVDGTVGITVVDEEIAKFLRQRGKPVVVAVNKCESPRMDDAAVAEFWGLGLGEPFPVSGLHGTGMGDLLDAVSPHVPLVSLKAVEHLPYNNF